MMKRLVLILVLVFGLTKIASAQSKSIGFRFGPSMELSYEHYVGAPHFFEFNIGTQLYNRGGFQFCTTYNLIFARPRWSDRGYWNLYVGPGFAFGYIGQWYGGLAGQLGLEYNFWFPLQVSVDIRPVLGFMNSGVYVNKQYDFIPTLSVRYKF